MALLCQASVIVEAGDTSGTLSQAAEVQRLGRPLFLMRSILDRTDLTWPARFIRNGAVVLERVEQILEVLADGSLGIRDDPLRAQPPALPIEAGSGRAQHA
jgi:predicted Rossmann fold nucleotide-binding protein DprA/Smf involved in DNA uptake